MSRNNTRSANILIRVTTPSDELQSLETTILGIRGIHRAQTVHATEWSNEARQQLPTGWRSLRFSGTELAVRKAKDAIAASGLQEPDQDADHDHATCLASARAMGVPAEWAHQPETYLSM